ncbi:MAG: GntR family transcriptional regulator, N-acetylglucosamine utilization regulator [Actinomycetota bacterium]|jgi:GntR family transcriptional regulator|nr:GntR family transcriptional regulator, N-acetylglucosamine utilization regulator [Actinomycetota bacterium]
MTLEPSSPLPLYHQLERVLAERIAEGRYRDGFPGDLDLAAEFSVSRGTVRQALERLARSGLIVRHQGRGSFVAAPLEYPLGRFYRFAHEMQVRGIPESSRVLARGVVRAPAAVAAALGLARGGRLLRIVRLRLAGDRPLLLETSHLPDDVGAPLRFADLSAGSMYDLLEESGVHLSRVTEEVHPVSLRAEEAEPFGLPSGAPAFAVERIALAGERPVEHRLVLAPGDRVTLTASWGNVG